VTGVLKLFTSQAPTPTLDGWTCCPSVEIATARYGAPSHSERSLCTACWPSAHIRSASLYAGEYDWHSASLYAGEYDWRSASLYAGEPAWIGASLCKGSTPGAAQVLAGGVHFEL
jgi:hypothetical protein